MLKLNFPVILTRFPPQPLPSGQTPNIDLPDAEPPQRLAPPGIYEHPDFFEEGEEKLERRIDRLRERRDEDESEEDVLTIEVFNSFEPITQSDN
ncbi:hypothetical protein [Coleofasciculus sp. F4-SAH-05]|uniref:hypothetical protein n=1 Tax=Coleofasciculus sp. F4-SAH-05 TaxID=3069525 RepID=UPI0032F2F41F